MSDDTTPKADAEPSEHESKSTLEVATEIAKFATNPVEIAGVAKLSAAALLRAVGAIGQGSVDAANDIAKQISSGEGITQIVDERIVQVLSAAMSALGAEETADQRDSDRSSRRSKRPLKERGDALLSRSWNAAAQTGSKHPAFDRILGEITPDEARILRFLAIAGPQPAIDIRTNTPFGIGSQRLAVGISFIPDMAGCAWPARSKNYFGNLHGLGLVSFSTEPVEDFRRYQVTEAHPDAVAASRRAKRTIAVYRSIFLSDFGMQFCRECFTLEGYDAGGWTKYEHHDQYWGKGPRLPKPLD
ncbi:DUF4393 domain-containing protein [Antrihabitans sp. YC3-6]|uniref:DUF4393 domain-containing protein n=1 Tax=Antrihabitans stalagmiti TaxID=2799499 RepID=A0A934U2B5_9NOCA|nr:Abi-alpha family protein [Antrihabitans stalagmiti]MBJ8339089.1 DUF4393 domain-containing protein [Antrihabitans stalagmiti]